MKRIVLVLFLTLLFSLFSCENAPSTDTETTDFESETEILTEIETAETFESEKNEDETEATEESVEDTYDSANSVPKAPAGTNLVWLCTAAVNLSSDSAITSMISYAYDENANLIRKNQSKDPYELTYDSRGQLDRIYFESDNSKTYNFDDGLLIESSYMEDVRYNTYYTYDENGKLISEVEYDYLSTTKIRQRKDYTYDRFGNLISLIYIDDSDESQRIYERHLYSVNEDNNLEHKYLYNESGDKIYHMHISYNDNGRKEEHYHYDPVNSSWEHSFYVFDTFGNQTASGRYIEESNVQYTGKWEYTYNESGFVTEIKYNDVIDKSFEYDPHGNLIKKIDHCSGNYTLYYYAPFMITDRELENCRKNEELYLQIIDPDFIIDGVTKKSQY